MFNKLKTILAVAVTYSIVISSAYSDAITDLAKGEFSLSTISEKERIKELRERDPFDALRDIETLNWLFEMRAEELKPSYMKEL